MGIGSTSQRVASVGWPQVAVMLVGGTRDGE